MIMNFCIIPESMLISYLGQLQEFTSVLISHIEMYRNSLTYLLHFWSVLAQDLARTGESSLQETKEIMEKLVLQITNQYIQQQLRNVEEYVGSLKDDILCDMDSVFWELKYIGLMLRYKLELGSKLVADLYDEILREYNVALSFVLHCRTRLESPQRFESAAETAARCSTKPPFSNVRSLLLFQSRQTRVDDLFHHARPRRPALLVLSSRSGRRSHRRRPLQTRLQSQSFHLVSHEHGSTFLLFVI